MKERQTLRVQFGDNNGKLAEVGFWLAPAATTAQAEAQANAWASALAPLSSALIRSAIYTWPRHYYDTAAPEVGSNVYTRLVLLFRDGDRRGYISVPSPAALPFDVAGAYRAIRLQREALALSALLGPLESAVGHLSNPDGGTFPSHLVVSGKAG